MKRFAFALLLAGCSAAAPAVDAGVDAAVDMTAPDLASCAQHCTKDSDCCPGDVCDQVATPGVCQKGVN